MALKRVRRRRRASITSLIDVIFLLLLFFMLASTFSDFSEFEISSAESHDGVDSHPHVIKLLVTSNGVDLYGKTIHFENLSTELQALIRPESSSIVAVGVTEQATTQNLIDALSLIRTFENFEIVVEEPS